MSLLSDTMLRLGLQGWSSTASSSSSTRRVTRARSRSSCQNWLNLLQVYTEVCSGCNEPTSSTEQQRTPPFLQVMNSLAQSETLPTQVIESGRSSIFDTSERLINQLSYKANRLVRVVYYLTVWETYLNWSGSKFKLLALSSNNYNRGRTLSFDCSKS